MSEKTDERFEEVNSRILSYRSHQNLKCVVDRK